MIIEDFHGTLEFTNLDQIRPNLLNRLGDGYNAVWLSTSSAKDVSMSILVKGNLSCVHYFPHKGHPGFQSVGGTVKPPDGVTVFRMETFQPEQPMLNYTIVPIEDAISAAEEFFMDPTTLPQAIEWYEL